MPITRLESIWQRCGEFQRANLPGAQMETEERAFGFMLTEEQDGQRRRPAQVFYGLTFREGDRILASVAEYAANYIAFLQVLHAVLRITSRHFLCSDVSCLRPLRCSARRCSEASGTEPVAHAERRYASAVIGESESQRARLRHACAAHRHAIACTRRPGQ